MRLRHPLHALDGSPIGFCRQWLVGHLFHLSFVCSWLEALCRACLNLLTNARNTAGMCTLLVILFWLFLLSIWHLSQNHWVWGSNRGNSLSGTEKKKNHVNFLITHLTFFYNWDMCWVLLTTAPILMQPRAASSSFPKYIGSYLLFSSLKYILYMALQHVFHILYYPEPRPLWSLAWVVVPI